MALLLIVLLNDGDAIRIDGPAFLALDGEAEFEVVTTLEGARTVWRISDAPGSALRAVETEPEFSPDDQSIRGVKRIRVKSVGRVEGDLRLTVILEKGGRRVATQTVVVRIGPTIRVPVRFRIVEHGKGGADPARYRDSRELGEAANAIWRSGGIRFDFALGESVRGKEAWFDSDGRFHPVVRNSGEREKSPSLIELWKDDKPGVVDVFAVGDCHWIDKAKGWGPSIIHSLSGVGVKEESVLIDDSATATTLAHELGHVLGLDDLACECLTAWERPISERRRLMFSVAKYREGVRITAEEVKTARATALRILKQR